MGGIISRNIVNRSIQINHQTNNKAYDSTCIGFIINNQINILC